MGAKSAFNTALAERHRGAQLSLSVHHKALDGSGGVAEAELDMSRGVTAQVRGAMRRVLAAIHLSGAGRPMFAPPRRAVDRELQERWPVYSYD